MNEVMSPATFKWFFTILVGGLSGSWLVYDTYNLLRLRGLDRRDPIVGDRYFGYVIGILAALVGLFGCLRFHGVV